MIVITRFVHINFKRCVSFNHKRTWCTVCCLNECSENMMTIRVQTLQRLRPNDSKRFLWSNSLHKHGYKTTSARKRHVPRSSIHELVERITHSIHIHQPGYVLLQHCIATPRSRCYIRKNWYVSPFVLAFNDAICLSCFVFASLIYEVALPISLLTLGCNDVVSMWIPMCNAAARRTFARFHLARYIHI